MTSTSRLRVMGEHAAALAVVLFGLAAIFALIWYGGGALERDLTNQPVTKDPRVAPVRVTEPGSSAAYATKVCDGTTLVYAYDGGGGASIPDSGECTP